MKYSIFIFIFISCALQALTIHDIQYTADPSIDGTYPSPYQNQVVKTEGIVTAVNILSNQCFIQDMGSRSWSGICVSGNIKNVKIGDKIEVTGEVREEYGVTVLVLTKTIKVQSSNYMPPTPVVLSTAEVSEMECYESMLARLNDVNIEAVGPSPFIARVNDGSGCCYINNQLSFTNHTKKIALAIGSTLKSVTGIVYFTNSHFFDEPTILSGYGVPIQRI